MLEYKEGLCWEHKALVLSALGWIIRPVDAKTLASVSLSFMIDQDWPDDQPNLLRAA
jgi:hypothetical protein